MQQGSLCAGAPWALRSNLLQWHSLGQKMKWIRLRGRQKKSGLTYLNQQNSVNISAVGAYYTPNQQKFYKDHTELYKFDIGAVIQVENK